ncbi:TetR/AcrR family transcriptional regulator [Microbacterium sp. STN6]|uniref:TetR/AcrR family transcriptional regulator n=1 Tax=Microbacterium sp. STN6 TaxID=2995588 RepID=UPI002260B931|nr:TetR/AcrR family transcriptional regulator [Microbacterium sp. STN6]MCX7523450.1 TetR/AcrR family transcriptional regulator [Microbacterium sp. STN6]
MQDSTRPQARERILQAAYDLFSQRGIRSVGVDQLIAQSGVANATFYRHFPSKDDLVLEFLKRREQLWTMDTIVQQALHREGEPREQLLAIFDVLDEWFHRLDYEGDTFINVLLEMGPEHAIGKASLRHLDTVRRMICERAHEARIREPEEFAWSWQILMKGAIIAARMGNVEAAKQTKTMAALVIDSREILPD